jgi:hypothetical protein
MSNAEGTFTPSEKRTTVKVVFRLFKGEVLALFPEIPADVNGRYCESYAHVGQHSGADLFGVIADSKPAKPEQYASLLSELQSIGYAPFIYKRATAQMRDNFNKNVRALR